MIEKELYRSEEVPMRWPNGMKYGQGLAIATERISDSDALEFVFQNIQRQAEMHVNGPAALSLARAHRVQSGYELQFFVEPWSVMEK